MARDRLVDKVYVVTGGGSGIGAAAAHRIAAEGGHSVIADLDADAARRTAEEISASGGSDSFITADISVEGDCGSTVRFAISETGRLDGLENSAGLAPATPLGDTRVELVGSGHGRQCAGFVPHGEGSLSTPARGRRRRLDRLRGIYRWTRGHAGPFCLLSIQGSRHFTGESIGYRTCGTPHTRERRMPGEHRNARFCHAPQ